MELKSSILLFPRWMVVNFISMMCLCDNGLAHNGFNKMMFTNGNNDQKLLSGKSPYVKIRLKRFVKPE